MQPSSQEQDKVWGASE